MGSQCQVRNRNCCCLFNISQMVQPHQDRNCGNEECTCKKNHFETAKFIFTLVICQSRNKVGNQKKGTASERKSCCQPMIGSPGNRNCPAVEKGYAFRNPWEECESRYQPDDQRKADDNRPKPSDYVNRALQPEDCGCYSSHYHDSGSDRHRYAPLLVKCGCAA